LDLHRSFFLRSFGKRQFHVAMFHVLGVYPGGISAAAANEIPPCTPRHYPQAK